MMADRIPWTIIDRNEVTSVYKGRNNKCCCGCAGDHTTVEEDRDEVDRIVTKLEALLTAGKVDMVTPQFVSAVQGKNVYIAYFK